PLREMLFRIVWNPGNKRAHPAADGQLIGKGKGLRAQEGRHVMERRRQKRGLEDAPPSARLQESKAIEPADRIADAQTAIEIDEVDAVAQQHVLAVVDHFSRARMFVGRSSPTK